MRRKRAAGQPANRGDSAALFAGRRKGENRVKTGLRFWSGESGQSMILFACCFVVVCMLAAVSVDIGRGFAARADAQHAADAAALAAAGRVSGGYSDVYGAAKTFLQDNGIDTADPDNFTVNFPYDGDASRVQVICSERADDSFARVAGFSGATVIASAVAQAAPYAGGRSDAAAYQSNSFPHTELVR